MCGRLNIHNLPALQQIMTQLQLPNLMERPPRYNITPSTTVDVLLSANEVAPMEWSIAFGNFRHPNTKVETIKRKPFLQKLLLENRCVIPVNRFYEWPDAKVRPKYANIKTRFCIHTPEDVMFMGGIYKISPDGVMQFNVLTTDPNAEMNDFHHRMPVIIKPDDVSSWFKAAKLETLYQFTNPYDDELVIYPCDAFVNNGRNDGPQCMAPLA